MSVGEIRFYDNIEPPLQAGAYTMSASQSVDNVTSADGVSYAAEQSIIVKGPQFSIDPSISTPFFRQH